MSIKSISCTFLMSRNTVRKYVRRYPQKAFRSCRAIMSLEKKYGMARLVAACACASEGRLYGYNEVKGIPRGD